jgi:hypothetical protein
MRVKHRSILQMQKLMFAPPLYFRDLLLTQSSRGCVAKLSRECRVMRPCSRDGFSFDGSTQALHCFFNLWQFWHCFRCVFEKKYLRVDFVALASSAARPGACITSAPN